MRHLHPLFSGNQYLIKDNPETPTDFINIYLKESTSISEDVDAEVDKIFNMIKNHIKNESIFNTYLTDIEKYKCSNITYKKNPTVDIFGKKCDLNIVFININDDIDKNELKRLCREYDNTSIIRNFNNNEVSYILNASLIINKFELSKYVKSDISHELRHAFTYMKIIENDVESSSVKKENWDSIYKYCQKYLSSSEHKYGEEFYKIIYSIYSCNKEELDAFTQQAYTKVKDMKSDNHIKFYLKETDLWNVINNLKDVIDILNKDGYREKYIVLRKHIGTKNLPSYSNLISHLQKRYKKAYTNYGKIIVMLIDRLEEDILDEYKYSDKRDGLFINPYYIM